MTESRRVAFLQAENLMEPELLLKPSLMDKCGCEVITVRISGEKLSSEAFSRILDALCIVLISFWRCL